MLKNIEIENFKSWKKTGAIKMAPLTGFFGGNSSGKTSIIQSLLLLKQTTDSPDRTQVLNFGGERSLTDLGSFNDVIFAHDSENYLKIKLNWDHPKEFITGDKYREKEILISDSNIGYEVEIIQEGDTKKRKSVPRVSRMFYTIAQQKYGMKALAEKGKYSLNAEPSKQFKFIRTPGRVWNLPYPVKCYGFPDQVRAYYQNAGFLSDIELAFEEMFSRVFYLGPLRNYPQRQYTWAGSQPNDMGRLGERFVDAILSSRDRGERISMGKGVKSLSLEEIVAKWLKELKLINDFKVQEISSGSNLFRVLVKKNHSSPEVLITDVGFGVSQILPVIVLCFYAPPGSTIILEQPEIHLHPFVQTGLADVLIDAIKKRNVQIILESHSEHLLMRLMRRIAEADNEFTKNDVAMYFCENLNEGESSIKALDIDLYGSILNWPKGFFGDDFGEAAAITKAAIKRKQNKVG